MSCGPVLAWSPLSLTRSIKTERLVSDQRSIVARAAGLDDDPFKTQLKEDIITLLKHFGLPFWSLWI